VHFSIAVTDYQGYVRVVFKEKIGVRASDAHEGVRTIVAAFELFSDLSFFLRSQAMCQNIASVVGCQEEMLHKGRMIFQKSPALCSQD
jgi:hypothetical protein